jgi:hypothetical protein
MKLSWLSWSHHFDSFMVATMALGNFCVTNDHGYVPFVVNVSQFFPHSWLITGFVTRLTRRVQLVEQELIPVRNHMSSPPVFSGVHITRSLVLCVCFSRSLIVLFVLFLLAIVFSVLRYMDSDYPFGLQTLLNIKILTRVITFSAYL